MGLSLGTVYFIDHKYENSQEESVWYSSKQNYENVDVLKFWNQYGIKILYFYFFVI